MSRPTVLVTGASGGLGAALATMFLAAGSRVVLHAHQHPEPAWKLARPWGDAAHVVCADLSHAAGCTALLNDLADWSPGGLDGLIHAAGDTRDALLPTVTETDWDQQIGTHLSAPWRLLQGGINADGFVVLIGSGAGLSGRKGQAAYAAAKAGMVGLTEALARPLGVQGVTINTVIPGPVETAMWRKLASAEQQAVLAGNALSRLNSAAEVAAFVLTLSRMRATSGQLFTISSKVSGGW